MLNRVLGVVLVAAMLAAPAMAEVIVTFDENVAAASRTRYTANFSDADAAALLAGPFTDWVVWDVVGGTVAAAEQKAGATHINPVVTLANASVNSQSEWWTLKWSASDAASGVGQTGSNDFSAKLSGAGGDPTVSGSITALGGSGQVYFLFGAWDDKNRIDLVIDQDGLQTVVPTYDVKAGGAIQASALVVANYSGLTDPNAVLTFTVANDNDLKWQAVALQVTRPAPEPGGAALLATSALALLRRRRR